MTKLLRSIKLNCFSHDRTVVSYTKSIHWVSVAMRKMQFLFVVARKCKGKCTKGQVMFIENKGLLKNLVQKMYILCYYGIFRVLQNNNETVLLPHMLYKYCKNKLAL